MPEIPLPNGSENWVSLNPRAKLLGAPVDAEV